MKLSRSLRKLGNQIEDSISEVGNQGTGVLRKIGWVSAGIATLAIGVAVGREIRQRYKFKRRTPYDVYAHAGDQTPDDFGVGI